MRRVTMLRAQTPAATPMSANWFSARVKIPSVTQHCLVPPRACANAFRATKTTTKTGTACFRASTKTWIWTTCVTGSTNCPETENTSQANFDGDSFGDACDSLPYYHETDVAFLEAFATNCGLGSWGEFHNVSWSHLIVGFDERPKGRVIDLVHNGNDGTVLNCEIPTSIGNLVELWRIFLINNELYGTIPSSVGNLTQLEHFHVSNNNLSGEVPRFVCNDDLFVSVAENQLCPEYPACLASPNEHSRHFRLQRLGPLQPLQTSRKPSGQVTNQPLPLAFW